MITYQVESFEERLPEFKYLLPEHYEELALNKDKVPLSPQWEVYFDQERQGQLLFVTARELGEIVGYFIGFVRPGLHYSTCLTCIMDIFYIRKDKRNGRAGIKLFQFVEKELKRRGVNRWFVGSKIHADASSLFKYLKFEPVETYYTKWLSD
ncbi:MAG: GNAT family N-acetyltransferase [Candidatus Paceibacterota bacterium]